MRTRVSTALTESGARRLSTATQEIPRARISATDPTLHLTATDSRGRAVPCSKRNGRRQPAGQPRGARDDGIWRKGSPGPGAASGETAQFEIVVSVNGGTTAVTFNGVPTTYTVVSSTQITSSVPAATTSGRVLVTTAGGTVTGADVFVVTDQSAVRVLPACYVAGAALTVTLNTGLAPTVLVYAAEDQPPANWAPGPISDGGAWDATTSKLKWGPFFDATARALTYEVTPPADAVDPVAFAGGVSFDGIDVPFGGTTTLSRCEARPADSNRDFKLVISEVTAYGAAWKRGTVWATLPNPIPIGYVTRAGYLWRSGETYKRDNTLACPRCWVVLTETPLPLAEPWFDLPAGWAGAEWLPAIVCPDSGA